MTPADSPSLRSCALPGVVVLACLFGLGAIRLWLPSIPLAFPLWLGMLVAFLLCARRLDASMPPTDPRTPLGKTEWLVLGSLVVVASALRLCCLGDIPPVIHGDSAECGVRGLEILRGGYGDTFDFSDWYETPYLAFVSYAAAFKVLGVTVAGLRIQSALLGILMVPALFLLVRGWRGTRAAVVAASLLTVAHVMIHFSRIGLWNIQAAFLAVAAFALLADGVRRRSHLAMAGSGVLAGLALFTYTGGRLILVVAASFAVLRLLGKDRIRTAWLFMVLFVAAAITASPLLVNYIKRPYVLQKDRTVGTFVFAPAHRAHVAQKAGSQSVGDVFRYQTVTTLRGFYSRGDASGQYQAQTPLLSPVSAVLAAAGLCVTLIGWRRPTNQLVLLWAGLGLLLGSVLINDPPNAPRLIVVFPAVCILIAAAVDEVANRIGARVRTSSILPFTLCAAVVVQSAIFHLSGYSRYLQRKAWETTEWDVVDVFERFGDDVDYYIFSGPFLTEGNPALRLFLGDRRLVTGFSEADVPVRLENDSVFVVYPDALERDSALTGIGQLIVERFPFTRRERLTRENRTQLIVFVATLPDRIRSSGGPGDSIEN